jgi:iron complex outermembrane receptor protein
VNPGSVRLPNPDLAPERQHGVDAGVDLYIGRASLGVTYYNQRAIDLIDLVTIPTAPGTAITRQFQNLSRVKNDGWEFEANVPLGRVRVSGTYSITNSIIQALPPNYPTGGYQVGDQVLGVPHTSAGVAITYSPGATTTLTANVTHIGHWVESDQLALYGAFFGTDPYLGSERAYWIRYPTVTKLAIGLSQVLRRDLTGFVRAENVGNNLRFEEHNAQMPMPRSVVAGVSFRY